MKTSRKIQASRKSKIPKRRMLNASRNRKALKTQKGGSVETPALTNQETPEMRNARISREKLEKKKYEKEANLTMLEAIKTSPILKEYPAVLALIEKIFAGDNIEYFKLDGAMPDPFIKLADHATFKPSFYLDWYKSKNPEFKTHKEMKAEEIDFNTNIGLDGSGNSIYETVMAQICRDILIMLKTGNRNMNNNAKDPKDFFQKLKTATQTRMKLLEQHRALIDSYDLQYSRNKSIFNKSNTAIKLLEQDLNSAKKTLGLQKENNLVIKVFDELNALLSQCNKCIESGYMYRDLYKIIMDYIKWLKSKSMDHNRYFMPGPFFIFPTYGQISYKYVLCMMAAPIINFRLINRKRNIHLNMGNANNELIHDIAHSTCSHMSHFYNIKTPVRPYNIWIENMSSVISTLYPYFNYINLNFNEIKNLGSKNYEELNVEYKKQIIAIILFIFLHEIPCAFDLLFSLLFEVNEKLKECSKRIKLADEWPQNIDAESSIIALKAILYIHRDELTKPMHALANILKIQIPESKP